ncbi:hypothetical protein BVC93_20260 [Mycobacterium sp. MS1601]|uniref:hypothetical protein n=1 Tax=Mycobacterium sp. MS1601 TaxID=1936029 RepID=UPI00097983E1|nr:hypothetical protein [Mycobacterium sp. MS1601]AQA04371.1 hypothetical protein BVC93_20260 [Mycobacterium sp. MS1601]
MRYSDVYEHGIEVRAGVDEAPGGLRRLATDRRQVHTGFAFEAIDYDGTFPNYRAVKLDMVGASHRMSDFYEERDIKYCVRSTLYHLNRLIELYVDKRRRFEDRARPDALRGNSGDPRMYFEVDAFLGAARAIYEAISKLLWKHYALPRKMTGRWRSITNAMNANVIPADFSESLRQSWSDCGIKLKDYRDCIMHNAPLTDGAGILYYNKFDGRWGVTVPLPSNPATKSRSAFDNIHGNGVDALSYCHGVAMHLVALCEEAVGLPEIATHLANPPKYW